MAYSPDGRLLALGDHLRSVRLYLVRGSDGTDEKSYRWLKTSSFLTETVESANGKPDAACIPSLVAQAMQLTYRNAELSPGKLMSFLVSAQAIQRSLTNMSMVYVARRRSLAGPCPVRYSLGREGGREEEEERERECVCVSVCDLCMHFMMCS